MHGTIAGGNDPNGGAMFGMRIPLSRSGKSPPQRDPVNGPIHAPDDLSAKSDGREELAFATASATATRNPVVDDDRIILESLGER